MATQANNTMKKMYQDYFDNLTDDEKLRFIAEVENDNFERACNRWNHLLPKDD